MTTTCSLDYSTTAIADKFGNLSLVRLPSSTNDDVTDDPTGSQVTVSNIITIPWMGIKYRSIIIHR